MSAEFIASGYGRRKPAQTISGSFTRAVAELLRKLHWRHWFACGKKHNSEFCFSSRRASPRGYDLPGKIPDENDQNNFRRHFVERSFLFARLHLSSSGANHQRHATRHRTPRAADTAHARSARAGICRGQGIAGRHRSARKCRGEFHSRPDASSRTGNDRANPRAARRGL